MSHLQERLPELHDHAHFKDLKHAIAETLTDIGQQLLRVEKIFSLLGVKPEFKNCHGVISLLEDAFSAINQSQADPEMRDLSILFYMENIKSIEMASFKMLRLTATGSDKKGIRQLLKENYDVAREDLALLQHITKHYFKGN